jgi:leucyl/phenylalanyl-tRNA--protein transferase
MRPKRYNAENRADPDFPYLGADDFFPFPDPESGLGDSVVAVGGNLSPGMLLSAYSQGAFPWFGVDDPILWQSPDPRFVLFPQELHCSESMRRLLRKAPYELTIDTAFERVIRSCSAQSRPGQNGTWITKDMVEAYTELHRLGFAHSVEAWRDGDLAGGFYGISLGRVFFGESMFHVRTDAAKAAFIPFVWRLLDEGFSLVDSQARTEYMATLGAREISRSAYLGLLKLGLGAETMRGSWTSAFPRFPESKTYRAMLERGGKKKG